MIKVLSISIIIFLFGSLANCQNSNKKLYPKDPLAFSENLFLAIRTEQEIKPFVDTLSTIDLTRLKKELNTSDKKLAFWINTYNSMVRIKAMKNPGSFKNRDSFFKKANNKIGGHYISLDDIENGILRRKGSEYSKEFVADFRVDKLDYRIHFTLNCGASSCPPIAYYDHKKLDSQLQIAEKFFVTSNSKFDKSKNTLTTSEIFKWFESDFGGKDGVLRLMKKYNVIPSSSKPKIAYDKYDWNLDLDNY